MVKKSISWAILIYAFLLILLGFWAYIKAGSLISLYSSLTFGTLLMISAVLLFCNIRFGHWAALFLTLILTALFSIRYSLTNKEIPAILASLSAAMLLFLIIRCVHWKR